MWIIVVVIVVVVVVVSPSIISVFLYDLKMWWSAALYKRETLLLLLSADWKYKNSLPLNLLKAFTLHVPKKERLDKQLVSLSIIIYLFHLVITSGS